MSFSRHYRQLDISVNEGVAETESSRSGASDLCRRRWSLTFQICLQKGVLKATGVSGWNVPRPRQGRSPMPDDGCSSNP